MDSVLSISGVTKRFGSFTAVDDFSLSVSPGELVGFLGPNGAGKTTTIRMVMNIIAPDEGTIAILGRSSASDIKDRVGYLPEERGLYRKMTVDETLRYFGRLKGLHGRRLRQRIDECLQRVELQDWRRKRVEALSKGMQQKLQFISTILSEPELVILDEPFSGLDPLNIDLLKKLIVELRQTGVTVLFSTHVMEQAERMCDRIVLINRGRKLIEGSLPEIRAGFPAHTVELAGSGDFSQLSQDPTVREVRLSAGGATVELAPETDANELLQRLAAKLRLTRFELRQPDLQEIFVRLVEQDREEPVAVGTEEATDG